MSAPWTAASVALLAELWPDFPASYIAKRLGVSRNAVIGKAHRLGIGKRPQPTHPLENLPAQLQEALQEALNQRERRERRARELGRGR